MSAPNPTGGEREFDALRRAQRAHEPSMEEILASIRAIIADDRVAEPAKPVAAPKPAASAGPQIVYSTNSAPSLRAVSEPKSVPAKTQSAPAPTTPVSEAAPVAWRRPPVEALLSPRPGPEPSTPTPEISLDPEPTTEPPMLSDEADRAVSGNFSCAVDEPCVPKRANRSHDAGNPASDDQDVARRAPSESRGSGSCARKFSVSRAGCAEPSKIIDGRRGAQSAKR